MNIHPDTYRWTTEARAAASRFRLPASIVLAVVQVESGGNPWAVRSEPDYRYLWDIQRIEPFRALDIGERRSERAPDDFHAPRGVSRHTEWQCQQLSWGLMQIMGAVARERGFVAPFMSMLCDPEIGLRFGCAHLAQYHKRFFDRFGWAGVLRAYNGGPYAAHVEINPEYPEKILAVLGGEWPEA